MAPGGGATAAAPPIDDAEFGRLMQAFGPFESTPEIAVAVSGGPDSLCLAFLMQRWTAGLGGRTVGLIIDHGLRDESRDEARAVERQLRTIGVAARVLSWTGVKPQHNIQATARHARYALLLNWCRAHGVIHLALGHHAGDQAETHLLRCSAGSGPDGLAGMAPISERDGTRILRPILDLRPERMRSTLTAAGLSWVDDPSNRDARYTRTRLRREIHATGNLLALCAEAERHAKARKAREHRTAALLATSVKLFPTGYAVLDTGSLARMEPNDGIQCLARIISCIGVSDYPPRTAQLEALRKAIVDNGIKGGRTLGGCLFLRPNPDTMLICREPAAASEDLTLKPGDEAMWDGRFKVWVERSKESRCQITVRRLEDGAWGALRRRFADAAKALTGCSGANPLPAPARAALPMLCDLDGPCALPHLRKQRANPKAGHAILRISFRPRKPLAGASFALNDG